MNESFCQSITTLLDKKVSSARHNRHTRPRNLHIWSLLEVNQTILGRRTHRRTDGQTDMYRAQNNTRR